MIIPENAWRRITSGLDLVTRGLQQLEPEPSTDVVASDRLALGALAKGYIDARRRREPGPGDLFRDPAWDILLDLYVAGLEDNPISVSSACIAAGVPPTTALRTLSMLIDCGMIRKFNDPMDGRRRYVSLNPSGALLVEQFITRLIAMFGNLDYRTARPTHTARPTMSTSAGLMSVQSG